MTPDRWNRIDEIFTAVADLPRGEQTAAIAEMCAGDAELAGEVRSLLHADTHTLDLVGGVVGEAVRESAIASGPPRRIGPYEVAGEIARGGMGMVYRAIRVDGGFQHEVAIKLIRRGLASDQFITRFRAERQILARLEHTNIARLLDGGTTAAGDPYIVMELIEGEEIIRYCGRHDLTVEKRLELFLQVCAAVSHAHRHLVIHRDIKPSNILVTPGGTPKLLDFGIAKMLDGADWDQTMPVTLTEQRILTPEYASPEHVRGDPVSTATDVYSLGAVLYEMLTGTKAHRFDNRSAVEVARVVCETEPERPSTRAAKSKAPARLSKRLSGDLDNIVLMALRKDPARRYESVERLAEDIRRHLANLPVAARGETLSYRARKFVRRNRVWIGAAALVSLSLVAGTVVAVRQAQRAERRFEEARKLANAFLFEVDPRIQTLQGAVPAREAIVKAGLEYLDNLAKEPREDPQLRLEMAEGYLRLGDVLGIPTSPNLGRYQEAIDAFERSIAIASRLGGSAGSSRIARLLATAHHRAGYVKYHLNRAAEQVLPHFREGLAIAERLYAADPASSANANLLLGLLAQSGDAFVRAGKFDEANRGWTRHFEVSKARAGQSPGLSTQWGLALSHWRMVQVVKDRAAAMTHARESVAILERLSRESPSNERIRRDLWNSYQRLGSMLAEGPKTGWKEAEAVLAKGVEMAEGLSRGDPRNNRATSDLLIAYIESARIHGRWGRSEAFDLAAKAERLAETNREKLPELHERMLIVTAELNEWAKQFDAAIRYMARVETGRAAKFAKEPGRADLRGAYYRVLTWMGRIHTGAGHLDEAEAYRKKAEPLK